MELIMNASLRFCASVIEIIHLICGKVNSTEQLLYQSKQALIPPALTGNDKMQVIIVK